MNKSPHKTYYDLIRLIVIFLVIFNHTPAYHFPYNTEGEAFPMLLFAPIIKMAVPLFFMISGGLLLPKEESISYVLKKRVLRFLIIILLFQFLQHSFYYICFYDEKHEVNIFSFISSCCSGNSFVTNRTHAHAVWFLYAYTAYLLLLPFLRCMVHNMKSIHFFYLATLQIITICIIPCLIIVSSGDLYNSFAISTYLCLCSNVIMWTIAGYFIENRIDSRKIKGNHLSVLVILSCLFVFMAGVTPEIIRWRINAHLPSQEAPIVISFLLIPCCTFFLIIKKLSFKYPINPYIAKLLRSAAGAVFCVMIFENIIRLGIYKLLFPDYLSSYWPSLWVTCLVWIVGLFLGFVLKKVPIISKLL